MWTDVQKNFKDIANQEQVSYLLLWVSEQASTYTIVGPLKMKMREKTKMLDRFMEHLEPQTNHRIHRYTLQGIRQDQDESVDILVAKIKNIAAKCKFRDSKELEDRILDQLIRGSNKPRFRNC